MQADKKGNNIFLAVIMFIVALGVLNAIFMNVYERMKEYAVMRSIGVTSTQVFILIISETLMLTLIALVPSLILAFFVNLFFNHVGIHIPPMEYGGVTFSKMSTSLNFKVFLLPAVVVLIMSFISSILPAITAARVNPCKLMRRN